MKTTALTLAGLLLLLSPACFLFKKKPVAGPVITQLNTDSLLFEISDKRFQGVVYKSEVYCEKAQSLRLGINPQPWDPGVAEIQMFEKTLWEYGRKLPYPMQHYKRQYFGFQDTTDHEKYISIRMIYSNPEKTFDPETLRHGILYVFDSNGEYLTMSYLVGSKRIKYYDY